MQEFPSQRKAALCARILVVDDEPRLASGLQRALTLAGHEADTAGYGRRALEALQARVYDLMILDLALPDMSGIQVMERALQLQPDLLVIVLTGRSNLESAIASVKLHAADYLLKPSGLAEIIEAVVAALQRRAAQVRERVALRTVSQALEILQQSDAGDGAAK